MNATWSLEKKRPRHAWPNQPNPEASQMSKEINIGMMINSAVQQGSPEAPQSQDVTIKVEEAKVAIVAIEAHMSGLKLPADELSNLQGELDTIKIQIAKPAPSRTILIEAAGTVRNIVEGAIGGMLTAPIMAAAIALGKALGAF
jgi:hypothetical protein